MAISLGRHKQYGEAVTESRRLAKVAKEQAKKAAERKGLTGMLGSIGGSVLGTVVAGALGVASGGLLMPLIMAGSAMAAKKVAHEATKGMGADPSKVKSMSKYGYGKKEAQTLRAGLEQQMAQDPFKQQGQFGKELLKSYVSAGVSGGLGSIGTALKGGEGATKGLLMGRGVGKAGQEVIGTGKGLLQFGDVAKDSMPSALSKGFEFGSLKDILGGAGESIGLGSTWKAKDKVADLIKESTTDFSVEAAVDEWGNPVSMAQGGMVQAKAPTISDYFGMQGVSLGGSNKHSLAEMLGRK